jgi:hypothetical protein
MIRLIFMMVTAMVAIFGLAPMAALTADRSTDSKIGDIAVYPVSATTQIYKGSLVMVDADGFLIPAADASGGRVVGVADENVDNNPGSDGDLNCRVVAGRKFRFAATAITQAMLNQVMYVVDDQTFDDSAGTNAIKAGRLVEFVSTTEGWIYIQKGGLHEGITAVAAPAGGTGATAGAYDTAGNRDLMITVVNAMRTLINEGIV